MEKKRVSRAPAFPPKEVYRIKFSSDRSMQEREARRLTEMIEGCSTSMVGGKDALRLSRGNGLVVASWDQWDPSSRAQVKALGVVIQIDKNQKRTVQWISLASELPRINFGGAEHWTKDLFVFPPYIAAAFGLPKLFAENMTDPFTLA